MLPSQATELKQQVLLEKASDPESSVSPDAAQEALVEESRKAGGNAFKFDPNASTADKAAQLDAVSASPSAIRLAALESHTDVSKTANSRRFDPL
jgi:hypothetical protein